MQSWFCGWYLAISRTLKPEHHRLEFINAPLIGPPFALAFITSFFKAASDASFHFFLSLSFSSLLLLMSLTRSWTSSLRTHLMALNAFPAVRWTAVWKASTCFLRISSACSNWAFCHASSLALYSTIWSNSVFKIPFWRLRLERSSGLLPVSSQQVYASLTCLLFLSLSNSLLSSKM